MCVYCDSLHVQCVCTVTVYMYSMCVLLQFTCTVRVYCDSLHVQYVCTVSLHVQCVCTVTVYMYSMCVL